MSNEDLFASISGRTFRLQSRRDDTAVIRLCADVLEQAINESRLSPADLYGVVIKVRAWAYCPCQEHADEFLQEREDLEAPAVLEVLARWVEAAVLEAQAKTLVGTPMVVFRSAVDAGVSAEWISDRLDIYLKMDG